MVKFSISFSCGKSVLLLGLLHKIKYIISSVNKDIFASVFPVIPICLFGLIVMAETSSIVFSKRRKCRYYY